MLVVISDCVIIASFVDAGPGVTSDIVTVVAVLAVVVVAFAVVNVSFGAIHVAFNSVNS